VTHIATQSTSADEAPESAPAVELDQVHKVYAMGQAEVRALNGVSLEVASGSFIALMGASGSGKSTLLNLIGCLDRPSAGRCIIERHDLSAMDDNSLSDLRLTRLGFIFQSFNLIPQLTVHENIALPLFYLGQDANEADQRVRALAERVGLDQRLTHRPTQLSGGQQQRVAIARALANDPAILLADEPTGNLDSETGGQILELLTELHKQGRTIVMVTHESEVAAVAQRQIHMRDGRIHQIEEAKSTK
jgi:putative ABC transport system ATP-binding protein